MRKTIILGAALALLASGPVMARGNFAGAQAQQRADAYNDGVQLTNTFEAPETQKELKTVPDISAPVITAAPETCGIPVAGGAAWMGFGFTAGTAYTDQECVDRLNSRQFVILGNALIQSGNKVGGQKVIVAGVELMCEGKKQSALARAGITCGEQPEEAGEPTIEPVVRNTVDRDDAFAFQTWE